ncbi:hypothetical protein C8Q70DRAFT_931719 [Cubamyces menziesii]|nr:hypothetical protein C8Q70DRAFT_931719 [Cubamyces menziesii]
MKRKKSLKGTTLPTRKSNKKSASIPRPSGQAGRAKNGFNLQDAMGLSDNRAQYLKIIDDVRALAKVRLKAFVAYTKQNPDTVQAIVEKIRQQYPELQQFEGGWPIRCALKQFLTNSKNHNKRRNGRAAVASENEVEDESEVNSQSDDPEDEDEARTRRSPAHVRNHYGSRKNPAGGVSQQHKSNAKKHTWKENEPLRAPPRRATIKNVYTAKRKRHIQQEPHATRSVRILAELGECSDVEMENFTPSDRASSPRGQDNNSEVGTSAGLGTGSWDEPHDKSASEEGDHDAGNQRTEPVAKKTSNVRMPLTIKIRPLPSKDTPLAVPYSVKSMASGSRPAQQRDDSVDILQELEEAEADDSKYWDPDTRPEPALHALLERRRRVLALQEDGDIVDLNTQICTRIDFECRQVPKAREHHWPLKSVAYKLSKRVPLFRPHLQAIWNEPKDAFMWPLLDSDTGGSKLKFLAGLYERKPNDPALMAIYEKIRVGYYGEEGEAIISSTLDVMFPPSAFRSPPQIRPFSAESFKRLVLVPEYCKLDDLAAAYEVMCESASYGYQQFPFDGDNIVDGELSIAQMVIRDNRRAINAATANHPTFTQQHAEPSNSQAAPEAATRSRKPRVAKRPADIEPPPTTHILGEDDFEKPQPPSRKKRKASKPKKDVAG